MGKETTLFKSKERNRRTDVVSFLHALADKIDQGQVVLRQGRDEVTLKIPESIVLEVKAEDEQKKVKGVQHSLEVELKWYDKDHNGGELQLG